MKIIEAYKSTAIDEFEDDGTPVVVYSWKYEDGTGNAQSAGAEYPLYIPGLNFDSDEPGGYIDEDYFVVEKIAPDMLPF